MASITFATPVANRPALRRAINKLIDRDDTIVRCASFDSRNLTVFVDADICELKAQSHDVARKLMLATGTTNISYDVAE